MGQTCRKRLPLIFPFILIWLSICQASTVKLLQEHYSKARQVRALWGHDVAQPLYQELLELNPSDMSAATRVAANLKAREIHSRLGAAGTNQERLAFIGKLHQFQFQPDAISQAVFGSSSRATTANRSSAPLYLKPLRAGAKCPPLPETPLATCIQLLLMATCLPVKHCVEQLGSETVQLMETLGIVNCETISGNNDGLMVPYCHVMPVRKEEETLYLATDLHPDVLSSTTVPNGDGAVMYIGPDSLGLLDHCNLNKDGWLLSASSTSNMKIVDIGCGSGIQGLRLATASQGNKQQVTSVDVNPRALSITKLNFEWNGLESPRLVLGDITQPKGGSILGENDIVGGDNDLGLVAPDKTAWKSIFNGVTHILANPPFLPVPVQDDEISRRYGLFSSGGTSGEDVLQRIVELSAECCFNSDGGKLAIVSEFMNPDGRFSRKLLGWWRNGGNPKSEAFFFSNQEPLSAEEYACRRADSKEETDRWIRHLQQEGISTVSPGFLYVHSFSSIKSSETDLPMHHHLVPKTDQGSIWTPTNQKAQQNTQQVMDSYSRRAFESITTSE